MNNLSFRKYTTIIAHNDLLSFLNEKDPRIFHRKFNDLEYRISKEISKGRDLANSQTGLDFVRELKLADLVGEYSTTKEDIQMLNYPRIQLLHFLVEITNKCNMNCLYCYTEANEHIHEEKELSGEEWIDLFSRLRINSRFITQNISLSGGEPTVHPSFDKILRSLSGKYKIEISSNGLYLKKQVIDAIVDCESLHFLNISMDSMYKKEDEIMRGGGTFEKRLQNLKILSKYEVPVCIGVVVSSINIDSLEETTRFYLERFGNTSIKYIPLTEIGRATRLNIPYQFLSGKNAVRFNEKIINLKKEYGNRVLSDISNKNKGTSHWSGRCYHMKYQSEPLTFAHKELEPERCNAGYGVVNIGPSGRLRPCLRADSFFKDTLDRMPKELIMPRIKGKNYEEISNLDFWEYVSSEVNGFNPIQTCAFKTGIKNRVGKENGH